MREKQRQKAIQKAAAERAAAPAPGTPRAGKTLRKGKPAAATAADVRLPAAKRRMLETRQDVHDLADEYALLRKLKKGKLSEVRVSCLRDSHVQYLYSRTCMPWQLGTRCYAIEVLAVAHMATGFRNTFDAYTVALRSFI